MSEATALTADTIGEYDFVMVIDASSSMNSPSTRFPGKSRWDEAKESILGTAYILQKYDADGIDIVVFGAEVQTFRNVTADKVAEVLNMTPRGSTPLTEAIEATAALNDDGKKAVAFIYTDGEPDNGQSAAQAIRDIADKQEKDEDFTLLFIQIGDDSGATKYLNYLDDNLNAKFDIVDTIKAGEADKMEPIDLINKAIAD